MNTIFKFKDDRSFRYIVGGSALAALFAFYVIYRYRKNRKTLIEQESDNENHEMNDRILYEQNILDKHQFSFVNYPIEKNSNFSDILYRIIMNFNKGNIYQGVVKLSFLIKILQPYTKKFQLNYNGTSVKYLSVNGKVLQPSQIQYDNHTIYFDKKYLHEKQINKIEVIFQNKYSFIDDGLSSYFILDQSNKYSLKEQVIYTKNGPFQIEKIIPCLNVLNECKVSLEVIYPDGFQSFSNTPKSIQRLCTALQYPQYSFFFALPQRGLNKSFKLNSTFTNSNFDSSTLNASSQTKRNSHFYTSNLLSIHDLFAFCSNVVQIQNASAMSSHENKILIRYFGKYNKCEILARHISTLNRHIIDISNRLAEYKAERFITKIDIFFVADKEIQGYYVPGAILLDQQSMDEGVHIKTFYLVARALLGMIRSIDYKSHFLKQKIPVNSPLRNHLSLESNLQLNELIFQKFPECRGYLFFKQQDIQKPRSFLQKRQFLQKYGLRFQQYYSKQTKFLLSQNSLNTLADKIPFQFKDINARLQNDDSNAYWSHFISQYNFLSPYVAELLLKISLSKKGAPFQNAQIIEFAKKNFSKSKYYLQFFTNQEIQNNLPYFLQSKFYCLQNRLTQIKIKEKFREYITEKYESYLPIKSNKQEAKSIYDQFKRFKQNRNFHHSSVLKHEIQRIKMFGKNFITKERLNLQCGFMSWKLLSEIQIYPSNLDYKKVIYELEQEPMSNDSFEIRPKKIRQFQNQE